MILLPSLVLGPYLFLFTWSMHRPFLALGPPNRALTVLLPVQTLLHWYVVSLCYSFDWTENILLMCDGFTMMRAFLLLICGLAELVVLIAYIIILESFSSSTDAFSFDIQYQQVLEKVYILFGFSLSCSTSNVFFSCQESRAKCS